MPASSEVLMEVGSIGQPSPLMNIDRGGWFTLPASINI